MAAHISYAGKLRVVMDARQSIQGLVLKPRALAMPIAIQKYDDPFLPFCKAVIDATRDVVCAYVYDLAAFLSIGAAGIVALERAIAYARADGVTVTVLHSPFASDEFAEAAGETGLSVDAVTLTAAADAAPYLAANLGVYVVGGTSTNGVGWMDTSSGTLHLEAGDTPLIIRLVKADVVNAHRREGFEAVLRQAVEALR